MIYLQKKFPERPIVIIGCFVGSKLSTLKKYSQIWEDLEYNVIGFAPHFDITLLSYRKYRDIILDELVSYFDTFSEESKKKIIIHGISIGCGFVSTIVYKMRKVEKYKHLSNYFSGLVIDSGPIVSVDIAFKGFRKTLSSKKTPQNIFIGNMLFAFRPFWAYYLRCYKYFISPHNKFNHLVMFNENDPYLPGASSIFLKQLENNKLIVIDEKHFIETQISNQQENDKSFFAIKKTFDSPHAKHAQYYPKEYRSAIVTYINSLKINL